jgi:hypothetical protein
VRHECGWSTAYQIEHQFNTDRTEDSATDGTRNKPSPAFGRNQIYFVIRTVSFVARREDFSGADPQLLQDQMNALRFEQFVVSPGFGCGRCPR